MFTLDAIRVLIREILSAFEKKASAQATLCELSKSFDCVDHNNLIAKLNYYVITGIASTFFKSYLTNRRKKGAHQW